MINEPHIGQYVRYRPESGPESAYEAETAPVALITDVYGEMGASPDVPSIKVRAADGSFGAAPAELYPLGEVSNAQLDVLQQINANHMEELTADLRTASESVQRNFLDAQRTGKTISDIRRYAIQAHREGKICRDGLDDFLAEFDLAPYITTFSAWVNLRVLVHGQGDVSDVDDVENIVNQDLAIERRSDEITIERWGVVGVDEDSLELDDAA